MLQIAIFVRFIEHFTESGVADDDVGAGNGNVCVSAIPIGEAGEEFHSE